MIQIVSKFGIKFGHIFRNLPIVLQVRHSLMILNRAKRSGRFKSLRRGPVDGFGSPIPWLTPSSISFIDGLDLSKYRMIEFGAGHSTLWFSARVAHITSYECDQQWIFELRSKYNYIGTIHLVDNDYDGNGIDFSSAEVVLVDGLNRSRIIKAIRGHLTKEDCIKLLIVDNPDFVEASELLQLSNSFVRIDFRGLPNSSWSETITTVFIPKSDVSLLS